MLLRTGRSGIPRDTQGVEGSCCQHSGKRTRIQILSVICAVLSLTTAMQAAQGVGNTFFGARSFLTSFLVVYKSAQVVSLPQLKQFIQINRSFSFAPRSGQRCSALTIPEQVILLKLY